MWYDTGHAVVSPVAEQGQVTTTHEPLRDRKAIVPLPQHAQFIEELSFSHCVGEGQSMHNVCIKQVEGGGSLCYPIRYLLPSASTPTKISFYLCSSPGTQRQ